ncbi:MAG TPA: hypothetical protein VGK17_21170, partial [Propionicimonas sp.]
DVAELVARTGVRDVHLRAPAEVPSPSRTGTTAYDSGTRTVTSGEQIRDVITALRGGAGKAH